MDEFFFEIHKDLPREGPGNFESTRKAFSYLNELPDKPNILDIGCGPGMQTIHMSQISNGQITAVDKFEQYLEQLKEKVEAENLADRITVKKDDMFNLNQPENHFDLIWSEGAIYVIGFEEGLTLWKKHLKTNGYIAVTELSWLRDDPPKEVSKFWNEGYPAMKSIEQNKEIIRLCGYELTSNFTLPKKAWFDNYYTPLLDKIDRLSQKYNSDSGKLALLENQRREISLYKLYHQYYGYVFYIIQSKR